MILILHQYLKLLWQIHIFLHQLHLLGFTKVGQSRPLLYKFRFKYINTVNKKCWRLDSNRVSLSSVNRKTSGISNLEGTIPIQIKLFLVIILQRKTIFMSKQIVSKTQSITNSLISFFENNFSSPEWRHKQRRRRRRRNCEKIKNVFESDRWVF